MTPTRPAHGRPASDHVELVAPADHLQSSDRQRLVAAIPEGAGAAVASPIAGVLPLVARCYGPRVTDPASTLRALLSASPVVLAPMENVTDAAFRRVCRTLGASLCVTEFIAAEQLIFDSALARRRAHLADDDRPTAIQIYGANPDLLLAAARIAEQAGPPFIDINCGCWIPAIARRGAGAGWLRDPAAMVEMARRIATAVALPITVKTRIGWGPESEMPIVDLARRLEDAGIAALTIHCRTAAVGHNGPADWSWARKAQKVVSIPVVVNGDIRTADDVVRALDETGCAAVMVGRAAISHPWIFREARARLAGHVAAPPTDDERRELYRQLTEARVASRGERAGVAAAKRHIGILGAHVTDASARRVLRAQLLEDSLVALASI
jgi:tRNA-dihydrouridine synthase B